MKKSYGYNQIYLKPCYSELKSRSEADISVEFLGRRHRNPVIPANMGSVINEDICKWLAFNDYFYIMHRFSDTRKFLQRARAESWPLISISVGVKEADKQLIQDIKESKCRVDVITIDIAQGHSILMKEMIEFIRAELGDVKIIGGNVATPEAVRDLAIWGADCVKVGIAGGCACSTKDVTGFHVPMFSCVRGCADETKNTYFNFDKFGPNGRIPIIADGSIKNHGDIAKALVAGATMVMAGSLLAGCVDAPGENIYDPKEKEKLFQNIHTPSNGINLKIVELAKESNIGRYKAFLRKPKFKKYYGSASATNKQKTGQEVKHIEGFDTEIPCNGLTYAEKYERINQDLASAVSYGGGVNLSCFKNVEWIIV